MDELLDADDHLLSAPSALAGYAVGEFRDRQTPRQAASSGIVIVAKKWSELMSEQRVEVYGGDYEHTLEISGARHGIDIRYVTRPLLDDGAEPSAVDRGDPEKKVVWVPGDWKTFNVITACRF